MELRHLRYFVKIAEFEHFGRAAEWLHVAQPGLSRQMRDLEVELGVTLFDRLPRGVRLSSVGRVFMQDCQRILADVEGATARVRNAARGVSGTLRLAFVENASWHGPMPEALSQFRRAYPDIELSLYPMTSWHCHDALRSKRVDAAFAYYCPPDEPFSRVVVDVNDVVAAIPPSHPLAASRTLSLADFRDQPMVMFHRTATPIFYDAIIHAFRQVRITPRIVREVSAEPEFPAETAVLSLVSAGVGVAIIASTMRWRCPANVTLKKVRDLSVPIALEFLWHKDETSPALMNFREFIIPKLRSLQQDAR